MGGYKIFHIWGGIKGGESVYFTIRRWGMDIMISEEGKRRMKIIRFYDKYGKEATKQALE